MKIRVGHGYDVHKLTKNRKLILGGVEIPFEKGLLGHSDADVLFHAIADALLGAAAMGDIGKYFPDSDSKYKDADSVVLLSVVAEMLYKSGYTIENIDCTVIAELPKLSPYINDMKNNIAKACKISSADVNVKATTEEELGFTGSGKGIAAHAVTIIIKK